MQISYIPVVQSVAKNYMFLFKDSVKEKIDTLSYNSWVSDEDVLNHFLLYENLKNTKDYYELNDTSYNNYYIVVWDFKNARNMALSQIKINYHTFIGKSDFFWGQTLDSKSFCSYSIRMHHNIDDFMLNISNQSKIKREFSGKNYKGFYGLIDRMSLSDCQGTPQIYINFKKPETPTIVLLYKGEESLYLIQINATKRINENIIDDLNLR
jgi:hypothetical protein